MCAVSILIGLHGIAAGSSAGTVFSVFEFYQRHWPNVVIVAPRVKSVCSFVSLVQTNLGTKSVCNLATKRSNGFGYMNLDHSRSHNIEKTPKKTDLVHFRISFSFP